MSSLEYPRRGIQRKHNTTQSRAEHPSFFACFDQQLQDSHWWVSESQKKKNYNISRLMCVNWQGWRCNHFKSWKESCEYAELEFYAAYTTIQVKRGWCRYNRDKLDTIMVLWLLILSVYLPAFKHWRLWKTQWMTLCVCLRNIQMHRQTHYSCLYLHLPLKVKD